MRKRTMLWFACMFLTGLAYQRYHKTFLCVFVAGLTAYEVYCCLRKPNPSFSIGKRVRRAAGRSLLLLSVFFLGILHMREEEAFRERYLSKIIDDSTAVVWGEITKIEQRENYLRLILSDCYISLDQEYIPCNDIMVYAKSAHFHVGEIHKITGKVNRFEQARNEGNFDSRSYYESMKTDLCLYEQKSERLACKENVIRDYLLRAKAKIIDVYETHMDERASGFYTAMVLGDRSNLDDEIKDNFQIGGISHILAISGLHVSILGRGVYQWMRRRKLGFGCSGLLAGFLLLAYAFMVGAGMSVVRAVGMMFLFFAAQYLGRSYDMLNALGAVFLVLLWENPYLIGYSGFWFSVTALLGVGFWGTSLGISCMSLPIVALCYYEIPLYCIWVNMLVLPALPIVFSCAVAGGILGIFFPWVSEILLLPCEWGLAAADWICNGVSVLPFANIITGAPSANCIFMYYMVVVIGCALRKHMKQDEKIRRRFFDVVLSTLCLGILLFPKKDVFEITFLDVGQGDGIYINTGDGTAYFLDGGSSNEKEVGRCRILPFLKYRGVRKIDYWYVSHTDNDHISGLIEVLESGYPVKTLVMAKNGIRDETAEKLICLAELHGTELICMDVGETVVTQTTTMRCLSPDTQIREIYAPAEDKNELSLVLLFEKKGICRALFTGDISIKTEEYVLKKYNLSELDLLKAAHHGSDYSNGELLLFGLKPKRVVISCSDSNSYGHPGAAAVDRMHRCEADIFYTMKCGQISFYEEYQRSVCCAQEDVLIK